MSMIFLALATISLAQQGNRPDEVPDQKVIIAECLSAINGLFSDSIKVRNNEEKGLILDLWQDMRQDWAVLQRASNDHAIPAPYRRSMMDSVEVLRDIGRGKTAPEETLQLCRDIAEDLSIKAKFARRNGPFDLITVTAHTKRGDETVTGLEVKYVGRGLLKLKTKHNRFDKFSSPTSATLPPGNYVMWSQQGEACGSQAAVKLGEDGKEEKSIDLAAPPK
jgi:hypothetical protein